MLKQGSRFFLAPDPVAGAGSEALRFATSPAPATEPGALCFKAFALAAKRQAEGCPVSMSPIETVPVQISLSGESSPAQGVFPKARFNLSFNEQR
jgi:hypothetical protein